MIDIDCGLNNDTSKVLQTKHSNQIFQQKNETSVISIKLDRFCSHL